MAISPEYTKTLEVIASFKRPVTIGEVKNELQRLRAIKGNNSNTLVHKRISRLEGLNLVKKVGKVVPAKDEDRRRKAWLFETT